MKHHVLTARGTTIGSAFARLERYIDKASRHWTGTPQEFRDWALRTVQNSAVLTHCFCDTPDDQVCSNGKTEGRTFHVPDMAAVRAFNAQPGRGDTSLGSCMIEPGWAWERLADHAVASGFDTEAAALADAREVPCGD